jgi:hypothetical protein
MKKLWLVFVLPSLLTACLSHPDFDRMSIPEILAYNEGQKPQNQVICVERTKLSSRIPKRECNTRIAFYEESMNAAGLINTASAGLQIFR